MNIIIIVTRAIYVKQITIRISRIKKKKLEKLNVKLFFHFFSDFYLVHNIQSKHIYVSRSLQWLDV